MQNLNISHNLFVALYYLGFQMLQFFNKFSDQTISNEVNIIFYNNIYI
jgi:hypothetical protein